MVFRKVLAKDKRAGAGIRIRGGTPSWSTRGGGHEPRGAYASSRLLKAPPLPLRDMRTDGACPAAAVPKGCEGQRIGEGRMCER
eukprot:gene13890-biopygen5727